MKISKEFFEENADSSLKYEVRTLVRSSFFRFTHIHGWRERREEIRKMNRDKFKRNKCKRRNSEIKKDYLFESKCCRSWKEQNHRWDIYFICARWLLPVVKIYLFSKQFYFRSQQISHPFFLFFHSWNIDWNWNIALAPNVASEFYNFKRDMTKYRHTNFSYSNLIRLRGKSEVKEAKTKRSK